MLCQWISKGQVPGWTCTVLQSATSLWRQVISIWRTGGIVKELDCDYLQGSDGFYESVWIMPHSNHRFGARILILVDARFGDDFNKVLFKGASWALSQIVVHIIQVDFFGAQLKLKLSFWPPWLHIPVCGSRRGNSVKKWRLKWWVFRCFVYYHLVERQRRGWLRLFWWVVLRRRAIIFLDLKWIGHCHSNNCHWNHCCAPIATGCILQLVVGASLSSGRGGGTVTDFDSQWSEWKLYYSG